MRLVDNAHDIQIPLEGQLMMQAADDVQLGRTAPLGFGSAVENLIVGHDVTLGAFQVRTERTESAAIDAYVRRIEVRVDVVIGKAPVLAFADEIRQFAEREQIDAIVQKYAVIRRESLTSFDLGANGGQLFVCFAVIHYFSGPKGITAYLKGASLQHASSGSTSFPLSSIHSCFGDTSR